VKIVLIRVKQNKIRTNIDEMESQSSKLYIFKKNEDKLLIVWTVCTLLALLVDINTLPLYGATLKFVYKHETAKTEFDWNVFVCGQGTPM